MRSVITGVFIFFFHFAFAQYCASSGHDNSWEWISNVQLNAINNASGQDANAYGDYTALSTQLYIDSSYAVTIDVGGGYPEYIDIWIDFDQSGSFEASERVLSTSGSISISGNILVPSNALTGTTRMRVIMNYTAQTTDPCAMNLSYGETEDYSVNILANTLPPVADFTADVTTSCTGVINFTDLTTNNPDTWLWDFGDGTTDSIQNPTHTYTGTGTYTVSLIVSNPYGADTIVKTNYITVTSGGPGAPNCIPNTISSCCGIGIYNVAFGTINLSSGDASEGYQDYSCSAQTNLLTGGSYPINIETNSSYEETVRVWIDYNNDGSFDSTELAFSSDNILQYHTGNINIPAIADTAISLRMRVASGSSLGSWSTNPDPCADIDYGQAEDYSVVINENTNPPVADFSFSDSISCDGVVSFTDLSQNVPTTWLWDFGDGNTDTVPDPTHTYTADGVYTITLIVANSFGADTITQANAVQVQLNAAPADASCTPATLSYCCGFGIYNVNLNTLNFSSSDASEGYQDNTCGNSTTLTEGKKYLLSIQTSPDDPQDTKAWIDFNNDGAFGASELIFSKSNSINPSDTVFVPASVVLNTPLRMRISSDYGGSNPGPCTNLTYGQAEDYTVIIQPNTDPPIANFSADNTNSCEQTVNFTDESENAPTSWLWNFGDGNTSTIQNPAHTYSTPGTYTVTLIAANSYGADTMIKNNYITILNSEDIFPYRENFETFIVGMPGTFNNGWSNSTSDNIDWWVNTGATPSSNTGPTGDHTTGTGNYLYVEASGNNSAVASLISPCIDISSLTVPILSFWYHMYGSSMGTLSVDIYSSGAWTNITAISGDQGNSWQKRTLDLSAFSGILKLRFRGAVGTGFTSDIAIDDVEVFEGAVPPVAGFRNLSVNTCTGTVSFQDTSQFIPSSWLWDFGDGNTSTSQNPTHTYSADSTYTVTLIACNSYGCDTVVEPNFITIQNSPPSTFCTPYTPYSCCQIGIYEVNFSNINFSSGSADIEGYSDNTCAGTTELIAGNNYPITVTTGSFEVESVRAWIDFNNDGNFTNTELVFSSNNLLQYHTGSITIPDTLSAFLNSSLRMRVLSAAPNYSGWFASSDPCGTVDYGQAEDYTVIIRPNTSPPAANFAFTTDTNCPNIIKFNDMSSNVPESWKWNFGDGIGTSTEKNPTYSYSQPGSYIVKLIAGNTYGSDTSTKVVTINNIALTADFDAPDTALTTEDVYFINTSTGGSSWSWNLGDGYFSSSENPIHRYNSEGIYTVTLTTLNSTCSASKSKDIVVMKNVGVKNPAEAGIYIYPNPVDEKIFISSDENLKGYRVIIFNSIGEAVVSQEIINTRQEKIDVSAFSPGMYILQLTNKSNTIIKKIMIY